MQSKRRLGGVEVEGLKWNCVDKRLKQPVKCDGASMSSGRVRNRQRMKRN
jgi:hypothetical protein